MNKRRFLFAIAMILMVGAVSGALVNYISDTIIAQVNVKSPIALSQNTFAFASANMVGGNSGTLLIEGQNNADHSIPAKLELAVKRWDGSNWVADSSGIHLAVTDGIKTFYNGTWNQTNWLDWAKAYPQSSVWSVDTYPATFDTSFIVNNTVIGYSSDVLSVPTTVATGKVYYAIVFQTETNLMPSDYRVEAVLRP